MRHHAVSNSVDVVKNADEFRPTTHTEGFEATALHAR
jgi:hypothetical protein